jgi:hypothetical protein
MLSIYSGFHQGKLHNFATAQSHSRQKIQTLSSTYFSNLLGQQEDSNMRQFIPSLLSRYRQLLIVLLLSFTLLLTTACNSGDIRGARPHNPPVQMGGQNNPYKQGGDGYTKYKMSEDPSVPSATQTQR